MKDEFKTIEATKRKKQYEILMQAALLYICFQMVVKCMEYFLLTSLRKVKVDERNDHRDNGISLIRLN